MISLIPSSPQDHHCLRQSPCAISRPRRRVRCVPLTIHRNLRQLTFLSWTQTRLRFCCATRHRTSTPCARRQGSSKSWRRWQMLDLDRLGQSRCIDVGADPIDPAPGAVRPRSEASDAQAQRPVRRASLRALSGQVEDVRARDACLSRPGGGAGASGEPQSSDCTRKEKAIPSSASPSRSERKAGPTLSHRCRTCPS